MATFEFDCPHCGQSIQAPEDVAGQTIACPVCDGSIEIEEDERAAPQRPPQLPQAPAGGTAAAPPSNATVTLHAIAIVLALVTCAAIMPYAEEYRESGFGSAGRSWRNYTVRIIAAWIPFKPGNNTDTFVSGYGVRTEQYFSRIAVEFVVPQLLLCFFGYKWLLGKFSPPPSTHHTNGHAASRSRSPSSARQPSHLLDARVEEFLAGKIVVTCPHCGKHLKLLRTFMGRKTRCLSCHKPFHILSSA